MRIRTVKPEFFTHEGIYEAEIDSKLPLRLAFIGLWCACDREGRFKWEPRRLGVQILPYDDVDFSRVLDALVTRGFLVKYACQGSFFGVIPSFKRHQIVNNKESPSSLPEPPAETPDSLANSPENDACPTRATRDDDACHKEGKGKEGKGMEQNTARFAPPTRDQVLLEAAKCGLPEVEVDKFLAYYGSNGWRVGKSPMRSWQHALSGWTARWRERTYEHSNNGGGRHGQLTPAERRNAVIAGADAIQQQAIRTAQREAEMVARGELPL